jgi:2-iminobutanoate/2-iminopropanoate deaminase
MQFRYVRPEDYAEGPLPYSPGVAVGQFLFVAGQASVDTSGTIVSDTFDGEMRRTFKNLIAVLEADGLSLGDVVQVRGYVNNESDLDVYNRLYAEFFSPPYPARTTLVGCLGTRLKFEIDVVACRKA